MITTERTIPKRLLAANRDASEYMEVHHLYMLRYDVNRTRAWRMLEDDLESYGLGRRYTSEGSFRVVCSRVTASILKKYNEGADNRGESE